MFNSYWSSSFYFLTAMLMTSFDFLKSSFEVFDLAVFSIMMSFSQCFSGVWFFFFFGTDEITAATSCFFWVRKEVVLENFQNVISLDCVWVCFELTVFDVLFCCGSYLPDNILPDIRFFCIPLGACWSWSVCEDLFYVDVVDTFHVMAESRGPFFSE